MMKLFKADLHIHTVLSPCGSLDMTPVTIIQTALQKGLDIIAITDHNSTRQCKSVMQAAQNTSLTIFTGVEVTSKEEVHCLAYFENFEKLNLFQKYLDDYLPNILNDPDKFGYQVVVDTNENILYEEPKLLITAIAQSIDQIAQKVHALNGVFIPAHINKSKYSLISQLGFIPPLLEADAFEITPNANRKIFKSKYSIPENKLLIQNSDAHLPELIGSVFNFLKIEKPTFEEFKMALFQQEKRIIES